VEVEVDLLMTRGLLLPSSGLLLRDEGFPVYIYKNTAMRWWLLFGFIPGSGGFGLEHREGTFLGVPGGVLGGVIPLALIQLSPV
jgi:hypothetical protein